jgi:hypothetical protein
MSVRICALTVPFFYDGGIVVGVGWSPMPDDLTAEQRAVLIERVGSLIQIHPEDVGNLCALGLELVDGKLIETNADGGGDPVVAPNTNTTKRGRGKSAQNG